MSNVFIRVTRLWNNLQAGPAKTRACFMISRNHIDMGNQLGNGFKARDHYFQLIINEMFLANERQWFVTYDPMAFVASSYIYATRQETLPIVVGPTMLQQLGQEAPASPIFRNIPVTGLHPYQGGGLTLTIILNRLQRQNNAEKLLQIVENISGAIDPSTALLTYLKIARAVLAGAEMLFGLAQTIPVVGYRTTINPDIIGQPLEPGYFALIDADTKQVAQDKFWVRDSHLCYGDSLATARDYRDHDFILFSIAQADKRSDERTLPFYPLWQTAQDLAARPEQPYWDAAKKEFNVLLRELLISSDLTRPDMERLQGEYFAELEKRRKMARRAQGLPSVPGQPGQLQLSEPETTLRQVAAALDKLD